jgi:hypothetical protein
MSFTDRLMIWLHIAFVIFAIGPVTIATLATPRYIRGRNVGVLRYLLRTTRVFAVASLGVLIFGIVAGQELGKLGKAWLTASMTLFVVALVLLVLIMRDQHRAIVALEHAAENEALVAANSEPLPPGGQREGKPTEAGQQAAPAAAGQHGHVVANVERGRIASMSGVVSLIWLVILVLMVWNS